MGVNGQSCRKRIERRKRLKKKKVRMRGDKKNSGEREEK